MAHEIILIIFILWIICLMLAGQAVATVLLGGGIIGVSLWVGPSVLNGMLAQDVFFGVASYSLSIIPMYLFMAQLLVREG